MRTLRYLRRAGFNGNEYLEWETEGNYNNIAYEGDTVMITRDNGITITGKLTAINDDSIDMNLTNGDVIRNLKLVSVEYILNRSR